ncbi:YgfZ/GcvT domain-containing protein [Pontivivens ytuae]|uniref:Folate-binding protein YgfZ n=1 Tax=Pontivivens ytuae TaxID=2789856 RepID=A0A7S9QC28_9RHOB|nr:folate-binding protein YgfZ [Pontivivens ytuae]QPH53390.1 folate-binding protein YgfZ [Pontivivens ytuae]
MSHALANRRILRLTGADVRDFLQNLVTNDLGGLKDGLVYAALLTPQGKYLADFFLLEWDGAILLDVDGELAPGLMQRLKLYKLRADVTIEETDLTVAALAEAAEGALPDPRAPGMGWRLYGGTDGLDRAEYDRRRVAELVPDTGIELVPNETYILEAGFERLSGVDFRKGCYVGQEVTARMKHKTELKKGLARVSVTGDAPPPGTAIEANGKAAGTLYTVADGQGLAHLRFDRAGGEMTAGGATVKRI